MKKSFIEGIKRNGEAVTDKYYYRFECDFDHACIKRLPISYILTTLALDKNNWKVVWEQRA